MVNRLEEQIHLLHLVFFCLCIYHECIYIFMYLNHLNFIWILEGMFFDHGCDAVNTCVMIIPISSLLGIGWTKGVILGTLTGYFIFPIFYRIRVIFHRCLHDRFRTILHANLGRVLYWCNFCPNTIYCTAWECGFSIYLVSI